MGSNQQGFWEMREQSLEPLVMEARCITLDTAYLGFLGTRMEKIRKGKGRNSGCSLDLSVHRCLIP